MTPTRVGQLCASAGGDHVLLREAVEEIERLQAICRAGSLAWMIIKPRVRPLTIDFANSVAVLDLLKTGDAE